jgi:hypothetical protein
MGGALDRFGADELGAGGRIKKKMSSLNYFFLSQLKELNRILCMGPRPTHRKEVTGCVAAINTIAIPSGLAFGSAMVELFFGCGLPASYFYYLFLHVNNQLDGLFFVIATFCSKVREYFLLKL